MRGQKILLTMVILMRLDNCIVSESFKQKERETKALLRIENFSYIYVLCTELYTMQYLKQK